MDTSPPPGALGSLPHTAEEFAAEAMAADMDEWIVFDPANFDGAGNLEEAFQDWLQNNQPSDLSRL